MTDKEFRRLGRSDLLDIIHKLQLTEAQLREDNEALHAKLSECEQQKREQAAAAARQTELLRLENEQLRQQANDAGKSAALEAENAQLRQQLAEKPKVIREPGSIAETVAGLSGIFQTAQETADNYIREVKLANEEAEQRAKAIVAQAQTEAALATEAARHESEQMVADAQKEVDAKWAQFNLNVSEILKAHSELSTMLGLH